MKRALALVLVSIAVVALAGCGGSSKPKPLSKADYTSQMGKLGTDLSASINKIGNAGSSTKKIESALTQAQVELRAAADRMAAMTAPADIQDQHAKLVKGVRELADDLDTIKTKIDKGDLSAILAITTLTGIKDISDASEAITKAGYNIG
ncbi:MAG: hypothetical protein F2663_04145 [Actinobacteria bacterium]|uniref:Unannotated protein n=1 Tax=freshwater metagenome TaxID=449393 RepID=A0A6J6P1M7_9ZZZZ|nr:hypothetical protein [Actinomycetota bacterium]